MIWKFPPNQGGQEDGFHNPGVETFKGNLQRYLAREVIQNSLDARDDQKKPVLVKFELEHLKAAEIPDLNSLRDAFRRCRKYWQTDKKATDFFTRAEKLASAGTVTSLRIADFNATGVPGTDTERAKGWYSLIRCSGASSKWAGEGGSFGIGKYAPFAASQLRTVLYSTLTEDGKQAFQGVAKLVSHDHPKNGIAQATGYLGDDKTGSIRDKKKIPKKYSRRKRGTDLIILGYDADRQQWQKDLIYSVLENFWPAIAWGALAVQIGDTEIRAKNLAAMLDSYSSEADFAAHQYYKAYIEPTKVFSKSLPTLKGVDLRLFAGDPELPKKVAMVRKTGMVIYHKPFRSMAPFCGVFSCKNKDGNDILRQMEPPRHDEWDPDHPDKGDHKKTEGEFMDFIRGCIKQLVPTDNAKVLTLPDLSQYLPDDEESEDDAFDDDANAQSEKESFERKPEIKPIKTKTMEQDRPRLSAAIGDESDEIADEDGADGSTRANSEDGQAGENENDNANDSGASGLATPKRSIPMQYRVFPQDLAKGSYLVTVKPLSKGAVKAMLRISAVGDDLTVAVGIAEAKLVGGQVLAISASGFVGPVAFPKGQSQRIEVTLSEPQRLAMEVEAHEA